MTVGDVVRLNRAAILGMTFLVATAGAWATATMPVSIFPEIAFHRIGVIARAGNLPVEQTLTTLTRPLESAFAGVLGVQTIRSETSRGGVEIDLRFGWGDDMLPAMQRVQTVTDEVRADLPPGTEIEARLMDTSAFPIIGIAVTSKQRTLAEISDMVLYEAAPRLRTVPGVYRVELNGAKIREYSLTLDPETLVRHRLDLASVEAAIRASNTIAAVGQVRDEHELVLTVSHGQGTTPESLASVVLKRQSGVPVTLGDVAEIQTVVREDFTRAAANGETAVLVGVSRQPSGNAVAISEGVARELAALRRVHPDCQFSIFYDQADLVKDAIASVREAIAIGLVLAIATIFFFIADLRATVVAAAVIPATILATAAVLRSAGATFNLMTLGGIAAAIGLVLDDAIVVVENFHRHRLRGEEPNVALGASTSEIAPALVGSTLTPIAVLIPLALLGELPGAFFRPLALTMSVALVASLVFALSFTPAFTAALEPSDARSVRPGPGDRLSIWLSARYGRALGATLRHPYIALVPAAAFVALAWISYRNLATGFVPQMDEGAFILDYWAPAGSSPDETVSLLAEVDDVLRQTQDVASFSRRTGAELGFFLTETNRGDYSVRLRRGNRRRIDEVIADVRTRVRERAPNLRTEFVQIIQDMIGDLSGQPDPVEIKLFGSDPAALDQAAVSAESLLRRVPGVVDSFDGITRLGPVRRLAIDERRASIVGLDPASIEHWLETAVTGSIVGQVLERDRAIPLRLRYPERFRERAEALDDVTLVGADGRLAPLRSFARFEPTETAVKRARENLRSLVRVTARIEERDLGSVMADVKRAIAAGLVLPAGATVEYGGLHASQQRAFTELALAFAAALAAVASVLLVEFGSLAAVAAIVLGSATAVSGSLVVLWATGTALNVSSVVGLIMVLGIVAKNGILLLDFAVREFAASGDLTAALVEAGRIRLRPILMTSAAAIAGLAPLAIGLGAGSEMQQPLAIAIVGGLSLSMVFSLLGVPLAYSLLVRKHGVRTSQTPR
jgi:CzcA family heavy metal efflux pump